MTLLFKKIVLHNFGSYADAQLDLINKGFCLVAGTNHCLKDNASSNGSGKSTIWSAICYALTGETLNGVTSGLKRLDADAGDDMFVTLTLEVDGVEYIIKRGEK